MADNTESLCEAIAEYISIRLGIQIEYVTGISWQERERLFDEGTIQILWICGLPYVHKADTSESNIQLLAAPVPAGSRYGGRPIYFSDIVVRKESPFKTFEDLRGAAWAYNEPNSHSGYNIVRARLSELGETGNFFGSVVESAAHQVSLQMVLSSQVDAAAIDSTVLEWTVSKSPALCEKIRVIEVLGPGPIPPWVTAKGLPAGARRQLRRVLLGMGEDPSGRLILERGLIRRFVASRDTDYDPIRRMAEDAKQVMFKASSSSTDF